jgi:hypothetical protein
VNRACAAIALLAVGIIGCATALQTDPIPQQLKSDSVVYFVQNHGKDRRGIDEMIAYEIRSRGFAVDSGFESERPAEFDVLVEYEDRWQWDISNYLLFLRIDLRDPETNVLLATGSSYQTSGARLPEREVVAKVISGMFGPQ